MVPISLKETAISNKRHTRRINFSVDKYWLAFVLGVYNLFLWRPNLIRALGGSCLVRSDISLSLYLGNEQRKDISTEHSPRFQFVIDEESDVLVFVVVMKILLVWSGPLRAQETVSSSGSDQVFIA